MKDAIAMTNLMYPILQARTAHLTIVLVAMFVIMPGRSYGQSPEMTAGFSIGLVGQGDRLIPSAHVSYGRDLVGPLRAHGQFRFSRLATLNNSDILNRDRLTYFDASMGLNISPVEFGRHRLTLSAGPTLRGRWEYDTYGVVRRFQNGVLVEQTLFIDERRSLDTGVHLKTLYGLRLTNSLRAEVFMEGYNYNEGTGIFFFGIQTAFSL
jgi:hypothetical protein